VAAGEQLPVGPFKAWLETCEFGAYELSRMGLDHSFRKRILAGEVQTVGLPLVDKVLTRAECPLEFVYPADEYLPPALDEDHRHPICREYEEGDSMSRIALRHGMNRDRVRRILAAYQVPMRGRGGGTNGAGALLRLKSAQYGGWDGLAAEAARLRSTTGRTWEDIGNELGYSSRQAVILAVKNWREKGLQVKSGKSVKGQGGPKNGA
jgi:AraC-like DNA-binding protein